ncbi:dihydrofolate reductase family protein [Nocardia sp. CA2R105]|uniref:dihydrofolate reductase family protein n=1 Tax=Nocardia coffeae TaxID=2873381 RepID=UPI001CA659C9|nr:dihydrofolate reductase family protein [Nocardia coffeae]MBY8861275.1 dihydrofolate reductase family protein [Nocardia coffeae]
MKLTAQIFLTLDGVMQGPGAAAEDPSDGFDRGGWLVPRRDPDMDRIVAQWYSRAEAILLGRNTFTAMRGYWPHVTDPGNAIATALNGLPKYVVSHTIDTPGWDHTAVLADDPLAGITALKQRPGGELQVHGSCRLVQALHRAGLIDEYRLVTFPVCVGTGKRLFTPDAPATGFRLVDSATTSAGAVYTALTPEPFTTADVAVAGGRELR